MRPQPDHDPKELHSTSSARDELLGDTNPSMVRHELGANVGGPVELDAMPFGYEGVVPSSRGGGVGMR